MDLEKLLQLVLNCPDNFKLEYSNINGQESLKLNGEELIKKDNSKVKEYISKYKEDIELLDDCLFLDVIEELSETIDIQALNELLDQDSFTKEEEELVYGQIAFIKAAFHEKIQNKIEDLEELLEKF